ncbi:unnamed protein product [Allacma fusca]|uniref:AB hydrolase-1 domain-containing protein n=1 Tax=Allacma fusca TaxID=39272 RepID=A0A8J2LBV3_9HEXA|nr:unnamed protein product [Allacma fusca]
MPKIWLDRSQVHYETVGEGPNVILCLPGYLGTVELDFKKIFDAVDKTKFKLVSWDPPGYGFSRPPDRDFTKGYLQRDADLVAELMQKLGFERYSVFGWSQGGQTGTLLAATYPSRVISLSTLCSGTKFDPKSTRFYKAVSLIDSWPPEKLKSQLKYCKKHYLEQMTNDMWIYSLEAERTALDETKAACQKLTCPVLVMHAQNDPNYPVQCAHVLHGRIKNSKIHIFPEGGHDVHLTHTDEFMAAWTAFVLEHGVQ